MFTGKATYLCNMLIGKVEKYMYVYNIKLTRQENEDEAMIGLLFYNRAKIDKGEMKDGNITIAEFDEPIV
jgi:hypothetical protein